MMTEPITFTNIFGRADNRVYFASLEEVADAVGAYERASSTNFRIRSTEKTNGIISRRIYTCNKVARALQPTQGVRQKPSRQTGCRAKINVNICEGGFRVTAAVLEHNHAIDPVACSLEPARRQLTPFQVDHITPLLSSGTPSYFISSYVQRVFGKLVSTKDICNVRARLHGNRNNPAYLLRLSEQLNINGSCVCLRDENNFVTHFIHMTAEQKELCRRYPEFIGIDSTYRTCRERYHLFQLVVIDSNGIGIPICFGFLSHETTEAIKVFLEFFKSVFENLPVQTMIMDDSAAIQSAVTQVFPSVVQLLCRVHIIRHIVKRVCNVYIIVQIILECQFRIYASLFHSDVDEESLAICSCFGNDEHYPARTIQQLCSASLGY